ncbi:hypothetical protein QBC46DRAFT_383759 [Diplogelasinospora grovesii]|uniref:Uncharacterized protein n=1 Tax=Diplogelasinospora grovesii TaxID=303347 RepID=A0AAN6S4S9_9PEZI|nr:hypothetical protein QBC46DRAFT_383759 [Diplogelasinospora grovesii]
MTSTPDYTTLNSPSFQTAESPLRQSQRGRLPNGVYVPMIAFFDVNGGIDIASTQRHTARLLDADVAGLVVHGSNGEAVHMSRDERRTVIKAVADAVRHASDSHAPVPIIAGCGAQSMWETVELCREAQSAGATHALILPPGYYSGILSKDAIVSFFHQVASQSPLPVLIYNFPAAANGVDLDSDTLLRIAAHPNIVGVKLTCGNTGKLARVVAGVSKVRGGRKDFFVGGGSADFILQGLVVGAHGTISGFANLAPRACVRIGHLFEEGRLAEAMELQHQVAEADWLAIRYGFVGVKAAMSMFHGEQEKPCTHPRLPFTSHTEDSTAAREIWEGMSGVLAIENDLVAATKQ